MFADDPSFFSVVHEFDTLANGLNHDQEKNKELAFQFKMKFNRDRTTQAQEIIFSRKKLFLSTQFSILITLQQTQRKLITHT